MKKFVLPLLIIIASQAVVAQNLVPNPSFETYTTCPMGPSTFGIDVPPWSTPDTATPDYYNACSTPFPPAPSMDVPSNIQGYQNARTGVGYAGLISADETIPGLPDDWREYLQVQLTSPLVAGTQYCIEFYWSLADASPYYVEEIGVYLSNTQVNLLQSNALPFTPQVEQTGTPLNDTTNWVAFQQNYTAVGGESFIVIGNFHNPSSTTSGSTGTSCNIAAGGCFAYYYIDDVSVEAGACCFSSVTPVVPQCETDPPVTLIPTTSGGTWSSSPVTAGLNTSTGVFDPSVAGIGTYNIIYTLSCGADTITVQVINCTALSVCVETNGDLTVTGGTGPYDWDEWAPPSTTPITNAAECTACGGTWVTFACFDPFPSNQINSCSNPAGWSYFTSGVTIAPPGGADTVQVTDAFGNNLIMYDIGTLPPCTACDATITQAGPFCTSDPSVTLSAVDPGGTWTGTGITNATTGAFDPATAGVGSWVITYTLATCNDTMTIVVTSSPNTGIDGTLAICPTNPATDLYNQLGGTPDLGGIWSPAMTSGTGMFDPAVDPAGTYTYTVTNSCGSSSNDVVVTITASPSPGTNGTVSICGNAISINLFDSLGGTPSTGGSWSPSLTSGTGVFDPTVDPAGTYTYSINDCAGNPQTADVVLTITPAPNTGSDGALAICPTDPSTDLYNQLGGTPDLGGSWSPAMTSGTGMFDPAADPAGTYTYTVTNSCGSSSNDVIVTITASPSPGTNGTLIICANASGTDLFNELGGTPTAGGTWSPSLTSGTGMFDPAIDAGGAYTYSVNDCAGNPLTADVIVTVNPLPNTGIDGTLNLCNTDPATDLFNQLGGSPDLGGTWSPVLSSGTGIFDPAVDVGGTYIYTITNGCGSSSNNVTVTITSCTLPTGGYTVSNDTICENDCVDFTDQSSGATSWLWTFNNGSPNSSTDQNPTNVCFSTAGTYTIEQIVTNSNGSDTITSTIVVNTTPTINAGPNVTIDLGDNTTLNATGTNGSYTWSPPTWLDCPTCVDPVSTPNETITYTVIVIDSNGCSASDQVTVIVDFDNVIFIPNIFSPNGDDNNDILYVRGMGIASFNFFIYDRWGEKVFETQDLGKGWDGTFRGKKMNNAVFVYYLQATFIDGSEVSQKGDITLIR